MKAEIGESINTVLKKAYIQACMMGKCEFEFNNVDIVVTQKSDIETIYKQYMEKVNSKIRTKVGPCEKSDDRFNRFV